LTRVSIREARKDLGSLAERALAGEEVIITRYGKDLVKLVPMPTAQPRLPDLSEFRASLRQPQEGEETPRETVIRMRKEAPY
jgi:prevent-host-death family protein